MNLIDVYSSDSAGILYRLLEERTPEQSISHKSMPTRHEHENFIASKPYTAWYLIEVDGEIVGATYLSKQREIGIFIFEAQRGSGYGKKAVSLLMRAHPGKFLANVGLQNGPSRTFFRKLGFDLLSLTYIRNDGKLC
jgi:RimJ/RimL family protein N-acetyltransferase